ncbi:hypothetical protein Q7P37_006006 [Cladosporium fusiforme]
MPHDIFSQLTVPAPELLPVLQNLKTLCLNVSDRDLDPTIYAHESDVWDDDQTDSECEAAVAEFYKERARKVERERKANDGYCKSIVGFQHLCQNLTYLELSWYRLKRNYPGSELQFQSRQQYMHELASSTRFPFLRKLRLGGLSVHILDLVTFVQNHARSLGNLLLVNIEVIDGSFQDLFSFMASDACGLEKYHLEDLQQGEDLLTYHPRQESQFTKVHGDQFGPFTEGSCPENGHNIIDRCGEDVKMLIEYTTHTLLPGRPRQGWSRRADEFGKCSARAGMRTVGAPRSPFRSDPENM